MHSKFSCCFRSLILVPFFFHLSLLVSKEQKFKKCMFWWKRLNELDQIFRTGSSIDSVIGFHYEVCKEQK